MKKIFLPAIALLPVLMCSGVNAEDLVHDDFSDGTTQGWGKGKDAGLPVTAEEEADGNKYIKLVSEGATSEHADKKVVFFREGGEWRGNFNSKGAVFFKLVVA